MTEDWRACGPYVLSSLERHEASISGLLASLAESDRRIMAALADHRTHLSGVIGRLEEGHTRTQHAIERLDSRTAELAARIPLLEGTHQGERGWFDLSAKWASVIVAVAALAIALFR